MNCVGCGSVITAERRGRTARGLPPPRLSGAAIQRIWQTRNGRSFDLLATFRPLQQHLEGLFSSNKGKIEAP
jgi:hypothetical protein